MTSYEEPITYFFWAYSNWNNQRSHHLEHLVVQPGSNHRILSLNINNSLAEFSHICAWFPLGKKILLSYTYKPLQLLIFIKHTTFDPHLLGVLQFCKELTLCCKSVAELVASQIAGKNNTRINSEVRWKGTFLWRVSIHEVSVPKKKKKLEQVTCCILNGYKATKAKFQESK